MNTLVRILGLLLLILLSACQSAEPADEQEQSATFTVTNPLTVSQPDAVIRLTATELATLAPEADWSKTYFTAGDPVPFQANDLNGDGTADEYLLLLNLGPEETKTVTLATLAEGESLPEFTKRTQAELSHKVNGSWNEREYEGGEFRNVDSLRVPPEHTDHSWYIRYEGPGWESDLVGYRFYLDWRNATDIFGKITTDMVLQGVGQDGFDSYHEPGPWGMDILKVGESLGVGSLGTWMGDHALRVETTDSVTCAIVENGDLQSLIRTRYYGWQAGEVTTDVVSELSIQAGSRLTRHDVTLSVPLDNLCTGIVKLENTKLLQSTDGEWGYLATWGPQSLANDLLGMAVIFRTADLVEITEDAHSQVVVLRPSQGKLTYYFGAAWEQEPNGITTEAAFTDYLNQLTEAMAQPAQVNLQPK